MKNQGLRLLYQPTAVDKEPKNLVFLQPYTVDKERKKLQISNPIKFYKSEVFILLFLKIQKKRVINPH